MASFDSVSIQGAPPAGPRSLPLHAPWPPTPARYPHAHASPRGNRRRRADPLGLLRPRTPGLVHVYTPPSPRCFVTLYPDKGEPLILGRDPSCGLVLADDKLVSRTHCSLHVEGAELVIRDRKSSHGVYLDGARIAAAARVNSGERHVLRIGASVFLLEPDVERFGKPGAEMTLLRQEPGFDDAIAGPAIFKAWSDAALAAHMKRPLFIAGESGTGKERVARIYHARGPRARGPSWPSTARCSPRAPSTQSSLVR